MANFLERMGRVQPRTIVQFDTLDEKTRNSIWNCLVLVRAALRDQREYRYSPELEILEGFWAVTLNRPLDEFPTHNFDPVWNHIKSVISDADAFEVLNILEQMATRIESEGQSSRVKLARDLRSALNTGFELDMVGFRFIQDEITPIESTMEADAVEEALEVADSLPGVRKSLEKAVTMLADRDNRDYANSVKEAISAVEGVVRRITGEKTLGDGLKSLERAGVPIHPALKGAWSKLFGWTSDENGVRHGSIEAEDVDQSLAKFMLVSCSAFVTYLLAEATKQGLDWGLRQQLPTI